MTGLVEGQLETHEGGAAKDGGDQGKDPIKRLVAPLSWGRYPYGIKIKDLKAPRTVIPLAAAIAIHLLSAALIAGTAVLLRNGSIALGVTAGIVTAAILAFTYRGLECLVHGASHWDIHESGKANDLLANGLMALPVLQTVGSFRDIHLELHHSAFAYEQDPCRIRMAQHTDVQRGDLPTLFETLKGLPREIKEFYRTAGASRSTLIYGALWHLSVLIGPTAFLTWDVASVVMAWAMIHFITFFGTLPVVRAVAETGEHDYARLDRMPASQVERTFDNTGLLNSAVHPCGDKWHIEHHLFPGVPQYRLHEVHRRLIERGFGNWMKHRVTLLGQPQPFSDSVPATDAVVDVGEGPTRSEPPSVATNG